MMKFLTALFFGAIVFFSAILALPLWDLEIAHKVDTIAYSVAFVLVALLTAWWIVKFHLVRHKGVYAYFLALLLSYAVGMHTPPVAELAVSKVGGFIKEATKENKERILNSLKDG